MIIDGIVHIFLGVVSGIISVFPSIPAIDPSISSAGVWITNTLGQGSAFAQFIYGSTLLDALIGIAIAIWAFEPIYHAVMWVIHKIPFLNVH